MRAAIALAVAWLMVLSAASVGALEVNRADYQEVSQGDLAGQPEAYQGKDVRFTGTFLFTGSDFCYQIRRTKINTKDYFCFALGTPSVVRLYLKKDHAQVDQLLNLKKGTQVTVYGSFDFLGADYKFVIVDALEIGQAP